jgi:hypothetical protein
VAARRSNEALLTDVAFACSCRSDRQRAAVGGGLFVARTEDGGESWQQKRRGSSERPAEVEVQERDPEAVFVFADIAAARFGLRADSDVLDTPLDEKREAALRDELVPNEGADREAFPESGDRGAASSFVVRVEA